MNTPIHVLQLMPILLLFLSWFALPNPSQALNDGLARTPPMGLRSWNLFGSNVTEDIMTAIIRGIADRKRTVDGAFAILATATSNWTTIGSRKPSTARITGNVPIMIPREIRW